MERATLEEFNSWWFTGKVPDELLPSYRRAIFYKLSDSLKNRQIISIVGLRRTGKTTLLFQIIQNLLENKIPRSSIFYFSFDEQVENIDRLFETYKEAQKKDFRSERTYIFLDEIQKLGDWPNKIKKYYDLYPKIKFFISGSESLFISTKTKETLAGRLYEFLLKPLSFREYVEIKAPSIELEPGKLKAIFAEYLETGGFPEMIGRQKSDIKDYVKSVVLDKIIFKDIVKLFGIKDTDTLRSLIEIIASSPGLYLEYKSLSQKLDKDRRSIKNYIILLKESFLIKILGNYRKGKISTLRKLKLAYPADSSIILAFKSIIDEQFIGKIAETAVINHLESNNFWRNSHEVDIVLGGIPVEVKYQNKIIDEDFKGLREFMKKFSVKKGTMITKNDERNIKVPEGRIELTPAWKFLLGL